MKESNSTSINLILYDTMWKVLEEQYASYMIKLPNGHDEFRLQGQTLKELYRNACVINGEEPTWYSAFRNFIKDHPQYFEEACFSKPAKKYIKLEIDENGRGEYIQEMQKPSNNIYHLHRLVTA